MSFWCVARLVRRNPNERVNGTIDSAQQVLCGAGTFLDGHQRWVALFLFDKMPPGCGGSALRFQCSPALLDYQSQSAPLTPADLLQTYLLMLNANLTCGRPYFSFFNCGAKSGASQPHKHVQFLPTLQGFGGPPVERVARGIRLDNECGSFVPVISLNPLFRLPSSSG